MPRQSRLSVLISASSTSRPLTSAYFLPASLNSLRAASSARANGGDFRGGRVVTRSSIGRERTGKVVRKRVAEGPDQRFRKRFRRGLVNQRLHIGIVERQVGRNGKRAGFYSR